MDHPDAAGNGQLIRNNPPARRGNIITTGRRQAAHRTNDRFAVGTVLEFFNGAIDFVRCHHFAARGIALQDDGFDAA